MDEKMKHLLSRAEAWIEDHKAEFVSELQAMTRIPSVSRKDLAQPGAPFGPDCRKMLDFALERGRYYGFETADHDGYAGSISYGDPENAIGIFSHLDVVPPGEGWIYPPYGATYLPEYDVIVGRGADDNKCAAVMGLYVMRMLREFQWPLKHGISLFCGTSEETGMQDMLALKTQGFRFPKLSFVPDAGFPVNCGQKGMIDAMLHIPCQGNLLHFQAGTAHNAVPDRAECVVAATLQEVLRAMEKIPKAYTEALSFSACAEGTRIRATGVAGHAAFPQGGRSAIHLLTRALDASGILTGSCRQAIASVCDVCSDYTGSNLGAGFRDEASGDLTVVYGVAKLENGVFQLSADSRTPVTFDTDLVARQMIASWNSRGFTLGECSISQPYYIPKEDPRVQTLQNLYREMTGVEREPYVMGGGNYARVVPNAISFGPGMDTKIHSSDFLPSGHGACHGLDEVAIMEKVYTAAKIYILAIAMMDQMID